MRFGSLFSGIGGFDLGFEQAGLESAWQVELDADCNRVLEKHWPRVIKHKDVRDVGKLEPVDVICGGFPCQDLSVAGKRTGLAGERSGLWFEFLRIVGLNRPRFVVIENVPGLLSSWSPVEPPPDAMEGREWDVEENSDFEIILVGLTELGYCIASRILDAQYDGVAQRRERVFIVGSLGDGSCAEILFESEGVSWNSPTRREARERVANAVTTGTGKSSGPRNGNGDPLNLLYHENIDGKVYESPECPALRNFQKDSPMVTHALRSEGADASEDGTGRGTPLVCATLNSGGNNGGFRSEPGEHLVAMSAVAFTERGREGGANLETRDELSYALRDPQKGMNSRNAIAGGFGVRRLTPRECERLQGFPDDWTRWDANGKEISDSARYRMLGNAVCVNVAKWIGERITARRFNISEATRRR